MDPTMAKMLEEAHSEAMKDVDHNRELYGFKHQYIDNEIVTTPIYCDQVRLDGNDLYVETVDNG